MPSDKYVNRHNGPREHDLPQMLNAIGVDSLDQLIEKTVPETIMIKKALRLPEERSEYESTHNRYNRFCGKPSG